MAAPGRRYAESRHDVIASAAAAVLRVLGEAGGGADGVALDADVDELHGLAEGLAALVHGGEEAGELLAELPVLLADGAREQAHRLLRGGGDLVERVQHQQVAARRLKRAALQRLLE